MRGRHHFAEDILTASEFADVAAEFGTTGVDFLDGDPEKARRRAVEREDPAWLDWFVAKLARYEVTPAVQAPRRRRCTWRRNRRRSSTCSATGGW